MKLKTKIIIAFSTVLILMILVVVSSTLVLHEQHDQLNEIVQLRYEKIRLSTIIENERTYTAKSIRDMLLDPRTMNRNELELIEDSRINAITALEDLKAIEDDPHKKDLLANLWVLNNVYASDINEVLKLLKAGKHSEAIQLFLTPEQNNVRYDIQYKTAELQRYEHSGMNDLLVHSNEDYLKTIKTIITFLALSFIMSISIVIWVLTDFTRSVNRVSSVITSIAEGRTDKLPRIEKITKDEIGEIAFAFNEMAEAIEQHVKQEEQYNQTLQEQNWVETKITEVTTILQGVQDKKTFASILISNLTPLLKASYGAFYLTKGVGNNRSYKLLATYAYKGKLTGQEFFGPGEGLVGQCGVENKKILLSELPDDYIKIKSGLGEASPKNILLLPIEFEGTVLAILELASFEKFTPIQEKLLDRLMSIIGIALDSVIKQMQVKNLLEQSQSLTEELQSQSEELQLQHEELRNMNEQLEKQYKDLELKTQELDQTRLELEGKASQLEINSQYKSEFLANMSHELRTPLNSMLILAQMFAENKEGNLTKKQIDYALSIHSAGKDLLLLIDDILDLAKVESGRMEIITSKVELENLCTDVKWKFAPMADKKELTFITEIADELPQTIITDEHRVMQILNNLLSNAFKFTEKGSVVFIIRPVKDTDFQKPNVPRQALVAISVIDTGIGIPQSKHEIIFEAFRQADGTMSRKHGGTGLGLSISRELAHLLGGCIEVESEVDKGSTFTLYLPNYTSISEAISEVEEGVLLPKETFDSLAAKEIACAQTQVFDIYNVNELAQRQAILEKKKVLIVDDDMRNVFALTTLLENNKMNVLFAENGREGIETLLANRDIDLVLMDIMMPEMDGYSTMRSIREIPEFMNLPIIALTAKAMKNDREKCIEAGASDYITKPINVEQLLSLMHVWLYR